jgi:thymidylate synthase
MFFKNMSFDLRKGFPILTTKKMFFRGIVEELLFFLRGETDSKVLEKKGINIWRGNTERKFLDHNGFKDREPGMMGPMYGYQWRFFGAEYEESTGKPKTVGVDQLKYVIDTIVKDKNSRRIIMTDFNPSQAFSGVLFPCHSIIVQFYVYENYLDMYCYNRSQDLFLGTPFNISSSALLLSIIAKKTGLYPRYLHIGMGDVHLYEEHLELINIQRDRIPYSLPQLILPEIDVFENIKTEDIVLQNYLSHPAIKANMVS